MKLPGKNFWLTFPAAACVTTLVVPALVLLARLGFCRPATGVGFYTPGTFTLENYQRLLSLEGLTLLGFTVTFACAITLGVLAASWVLAWPMRCWQGPALVAGVLLLLLPRLAGMLAPLVVLKRFLPQGVLAAWLAEIYLITPYAALVLLVQWRAVDWTLLHAARGLGARPRQVFTRVALPLALPGLWLAGQLALGWGLGAFLGPEMLAGPSGRTLASDLHHQAFDNNRWPFAAAEGTVLALLVALVFLRKPQAAAIPEAAP